MNPHEMTLGSPNPRKLMLASVRIAHPTASEPYRKDNGSTLGAMCTNIVRTWLAPSTRAASTYDRVRRVSNRAERNVWSWPTGLSECNRRPIRQASIVHEG